MLTGVIEQIERAALRVEPTRAVRILGGLPPSAIRALQRARFRRTLRLAARAPFYREEFRRRGIDVPRIREPSDLGDFFTTGEDLRSHGPEAFLVGRPDTAFETTGTTSATPKQIYLSTREMNDLGRPSAIALQLLGLRPEDRVLSAFDCSFWVSPWVFRTAVQYVRCFHVEGGKIDPQEFFERARSYRPTVIVGEPSWLVRLAEVASKRERWPVKFLFGGGENITETSRHMVERTWGAPLYMNYGQTEAFGSLGIECARQKGYHRNDLCFYFELADAGPDGYGELVYTTLSRSVMPLIRYRSTDVTQLVDERCDCGLFIGRIGKIRARTDEMVVCGMGNIGPWVFAEVLRGIPEVGSDWQAVVQHDGRRDFVELRVELRDARPSVDLEKAIHRNLRERFPDFWKNYEMRLFDLRIAALEPGSLRGAGRKLRRVIDERQMLMRRVS